MTTNQAAYTPDDNASVATLLRRAQWYRHSAVWAEDRILRDDRMRAADYLETEAIRRTNPSFFRHVSAA